MNLLNKLSSMQQEFKVKITSKAKSSRLHSKTTNESLLSKAHIYKRHSTHDWILPTHRRSGRESTRFQAPFRTRPQLSKPSADLDLWPFVLCCSVAAKMRLASGRDPGAVYWNDGDVTWAVVHSWSRQVNRSIYGLLLSNAFTIDTVWQVTGCNVFLFRRFTAKMKSGGFIVTLFEAFAWKIWVLKSTCFTSIMWHI